MFYRLKSNSFLSIHLELSTLGYLQIQFNISKPYSEEHVLSRLFFESSTGTLRNSFAWRVSFRYEIIHFLFFFFCRSLNILISCARVWKASCTPFPRFAEVSMYVIPCESANFLAVSGPTLRRDRSTLLPITEKDVATTNVKISSVNNYGYSNSQTIGGVQSTVYLTRFICSRC